MQYEFRGKSLSQAISNSLARPSRIEQKATASIDAGSGSYNSESVSVNVNAGRNYTVSWSAQDPAGDCAIYGIRIQSSDGHGSHREAFRNYGSWSFRANSTGEAEFVIGVSYSGSVLFGDYTVDIDID